MKAAEFTNTNAYEPPVHVLAGIAGGYIHMLSQQAVVRPICVMITLIGCDEEKGPQVYKIDPSGQCFGYKCAATGTKEQEATTYLEKAYKKNEGQWTAKETVMTAIRTLQTVISTDFKSNEIEIGFASVENPRFRVLPNHEVDDILTQMADQI